MKYYEKVGGDLLFLSPVCQEDAPIYTRWMNDPQVTDGLGNTSFVFSLEKEQKFLQENMDGYTLHPGEQVVYNKESGEVTVANVDVSYVTAWREGRLRFRDRPLKEIMDFISRWYDVDVVYEDEVVKNYLFGCNFNRHVTVTPLLELFQSTGTVRFEVVGKKIIVKK